MYSLIQTFIYEIMYDANTQPAYTERDSKIGISAAPKLKFDF